LVLDRLPRARLLSTMTEVVGSRPGEGVQSFAFGAASASSRAQPAPLLADRVRVGSRSGR
jgi:hypothetical protein